MKHKQVIPSLNSRKDMLNPKQELMLNLVFILVMILGVQIIHASTL